MGLGKGDAPELTKRRLSAEIGKGKGFRRRKRLLLGVRRGGLMERGKRRPSKEKKWTLRWERRRHKKGVGRVRTPNTKKLRFKEERLSREKGQRKRKPSEPIILTSSQTKWVKSGAAKDSQIFLRRSPSRGESGKKIQLFDDEVQGRRIYFKKQS